MGDHEMRSRLYAGNSEYPAVLAPKRSSENPSGADNQQERLVTAKVMRILRGHTPTLFDLSRKRMRWSVPYGDVGRLMETSARHSGTNAT